MKGGGEMQNEMCRNFRREFCKSLYMNPAESDISLNVTTDENSFTIPGHSLVLCFQSPVFRAALDNGDTFIEGRKKEFALKVRSPRTAEYFLRFQYCGILPKLIYLPDLMELTEMAHMYQNKELLKLCNERLVCIGTEKLKTFACEMYEFASLLGLKELQTKCTNVIITYSEYICKEELFFPLLEQHVGYFNLEIFLASSTNEDIISTLTFWKRWVFCTSENTVDGSKLDTATEFPANNPCSEMPESLSSLCLNTYRSDMELLVDGNLKLPAHSLILMTQSGVIKSQFHKIKGSDNCLPQIALEGVDLICAAHLIRYQYSGFISKDLPVHTLVKLLKSSVLYQIDNLQAICERLLKWKFSLENVCILLRIAKQYHLKNLLSACINYIKTESYIRDIYVNQLHFVLDKELLEILISNSGCSRQQEQIFEWGKWRASYEGVEFEKETLEKIIHTVVK